MIFSEIYGSYYRTVSKIIDEALDGGLTDSKISKIVSEEAFGESMLTIPDSLKNQRWPLIDMDKHTIIRNRTEIPLTYLQKSWLKAIMSDPRVQLFSPAIEGLEDIDPLYDVNTFVYFDQYSDGDDFENESYKANFRTVLRAIKEKKWILIRFRASRGRKRSDKFIPSRLEYSSKDNKFRLEAANKSGSYTINISRIMSCNILEKYSEEEYIEPKIRMSEMVVELTDERNALERAMLHFSHLEKETEKLEDGKYRIRIKYRKDDETELLIRILSFGPMIKVIAPDRFVDNIKERIDKQLSCVL